MWRVISQIFVVGSVGVISACANLNSIDRTTSLPRNNQGKAVHLDAQQRTLTVNDAGIICSEPSPDALAAFAAAAGLGLSIPGSGAGSLAAGQQSSAASIGLRTQSITLMRDALYRMCEAYANGAISPAQIATLLGRSQDLTAVILAVEQLTGAVAANQVALTGTTSASAAASLVSNQQLLDQARENEAEKEKKLDEAKLALAAAKKTRDQKVTNEASARVERDRTTAPGSASTDTQKTEAQSKLEQSQADLDQANIDLKAAENLVETRKTLLEEAKATREAIEAAKDAALTSASAGTTSAAQFSVPIGRKQLSDSATKEIAGSVETMVTAVLRKEYTEDACMAMLTFVPPDYDDWGSSKKSYLERVQELCTRIIERGLEKRLAPVAFGADTSTDRINSWFDLNSENTAKLSEWMKSKNLDFRITSLLYGSNNAELRNSAISELKIP